MSEARAVYSVIQYWPNLARAEGVNIGVVLVCSERRCIATKMSPNSERVKRAFGASTVDVARLEVAKRSLVRRLASIEPTEAAFDSFIASQGNNLVVLPPRPVAVADVDTTLAELFTELVGATTPITRDRATKGPDLDAYFQRLIKDGAE